MADNVLDSTGIDFTKFERVDHTGLIPAVVQDAANGQVLMLGYMNAEALRRTLESGRMTYWTRERQTYWVKGETSGHFQNLKSASYDCDGDALLFQVEQVGAACHTGERSCFHRELTS